MLSPALTSYVFLISLVLSNNSRTLICMYTYIKTGYCYVYNGINFSLDWKDDLLLYTYIGILSRRKVINKYIFCEYKCCCMLHGPRNSRVWQHSVSSYLSNHKWYTMHILRTSKCACIIMQLLYVYLDCHVSLVFHVRFRGSWRCICICVISYRPPTNSTPHSETDTGTTSTESQPTNNDITTETAEMTASHPLTNSISVFNLLEEIAILQRSLHIKKGGSVVIVVSYVIIVMLIMYTVFLSVIVLYIVFATLNYD